MEHVHRNKVTPKKLIELLKKHKRIKVCVTEADGKGHVQRERIITSKGTSKVRYANVVWKIDDKNAYVLDDKGQRIFERYEWCKYNMSCYSRYLTKDGDPKLNIIKNKAEAIIRAMKKHDRKYYVVVEVYTGSNFKKRLV